MLRGNASAHLPASDHCRCARGGFCERRRAVGRSRGVCARVAHPDGCAPAPIRACGGASGFASVCVGHSVSWFVSDSVFQVLSGILFGMGLAFLSISWFLLLRDTPFVRILTHAALVVLGALLVNGVAFFLQAEAATALRELLLFVGVVAVLACVLVEPPEGGVARVAARESGGWDEDATRGIAGSGVVFAGVGGVRGVFQFP